VVLVVSRGPKTRRNPVELYGRANGVRTNRKMTTTSITKHVHFIRAPGTRFTRPPPALSIAVPRFRILIFDNFRTPRSPSRYHTAFDRRLNILTISRRAAVRRRTVRRVQAFAVRTAFVSRFVLNRLAPKRKYLLEK
jgi:hypothetical protein